MAAKNPTLTRFERANAKRRLWDPILKDAYAFCLPNYGPLAASAASTTTRTGEKRGLEVFDGTGGEALEDRAAYTVGGLFPDSESWIAAQKGLEDRYNADFAVYTEKTFAKVQSAFDHSNFMAEIVPAMREAYISVGAITCDFGDAAMPLNFEAAPIGQITPEDSFDGVIRTNFRSFDIPIKDIRAKWKDIKAVPQKLAARLFSDANAKVTIVEAEIYNHDTRRTEFSVIVKDDGMELLKRDDTIGRTLPFRVDKAPGETMGRGPVLAAMPDIMVLNKVDELVLKNASIAVTGIWQADDDGVINVANIQLKPGAIIPKAVGSQGLTPLQAPGRFDISKMLGDERQQRVRRKIFGQNLPPVQDAGKATAFEIGERVRAFETIEGPHLRRLIPELFTRLVKRALYILMHPSMAGSIFAVPAFAGLSIAETLDHLMDALENPEEAVKRKRADAQADQAVANAIAVMGPGIDQVLDLPEYMRKQLQREGVDAALIVDAKAATAANEQDQAMQVAALAAGGGGSDASGQAQAPAPVPAHLQLMPGSGAL